MCEDDARVMLKKAGTDASTTAQLKKATNKILEEHHAILFLYKSDNAKYGQLIEQIENYSLYIFCLFSQVKNFNKWPFLHLKLALLCC